MRGFDHTAPIVRVVHGFQTPEKGMYSGPWIEDLGSVARRSGAAQRGTLLREQEPYIRPI